MYVTRDLLYRAGGEDSAGEKLGRTAVAVGASLLLGGVVGYRDAKGIEADKLMPALGPVPLDLGLGIAATLGSLAMSGTDWEGYSWVSEEIGKGSFCFFGASAGQALGKKLYEQMNKKSGSGTGAEMLAGGGYRDAHGRFLNGGAQVPGQTSQQVGFAGKRP